MLPIGPTGFGDSPYQSPSTFAGNPLLISLDDLVDDGLLDPDEVTAALDAEHVDFGAVIPWKRGLLDVAAKRFTARPTHAVFDAFLDEHMATWLDDFSVFTALKRAHALEPWWRWDDAARNRDPAAMAAIRSTLSESIQIVLAEQFLFDVGFRRLRAACASVGVGLVGDIPIFVAHDSADVWANPSLYHLDGHGNPTVVAGVPPDYFSVTGQRWGNPLYDWDRHVETDFAWWTERMRRAFDLFDLVRIDHFRGFCAAWHIPVDAPTAIDGSWAPAPGEQLFSHLRSVFGELPVIAEDLGVITPDVEALRDDFDLPGMKVLQFGFGTESAHAMEQFSEHVVAYTGTHDNDTARGWFESEDPLRIPERETALTALGSDGSEFSWDLIEATFASVAAIAIVPLQDVLSLGAEGRMNTPGTASGNWRWRFQWHQLKPQLVARMADLVRRSRR
jgi:4-alpha-glucanotransferase